MLLYQHCTFHPHHLCPGFLQHPPVQQCRLLRRQAYACLKWTVWSKWRVTSASRKMTRWGVLLFYSKIPWTQDLYKLIQPSIIVFNFFSGYYNLSTPRQNVVTEGHIEHWGSNLKGLHTHEDWGCGLELEVIPNY